MKIGYARVSTQDQSLDAQVDALKKAGCSIVYEEKVTGTKASRPELDKMLEALNPDDTLVITKLDRLGRSLKNLIALVDLLKKKQVNFISLSDSIDTSSAMGKFIFHVFASLSELERNMISERTKSALAYIKSQSYPKGKPGRKPLPNEVTDQIILLRNRGEKYSAIAKQLNVSIKSIQRVVKKYL